MPSSVGHDILSQMNVIMCTPNEIFTRQMFNHRGLAITHRASNTPSWLFKKQTVWVLGLPHSPFPSWPLPVLYPMPMILLGNHVPCMGGSMASGSRKIKGSNDASAGIACWRTYKTQKFPMEFHNYLCKEKFREMVSTPRLESLKHGHYSLLGSPSSSPLLHGYSLWLP